jgi:Putative polyhydroxyalkanoic acid system protein (PHA_gran_rgn)
MFHPMQRPIDVNMPHKLGREEARRRIASNIGSLQNHIPGGATVMDSTWSGDTLNLKINAMGQTVDAQVAVEETKLNVRVMLSGMLAMLAGPIEAVLNKKGSDLLLEDKHKK